MSKDYMKQRGETIRFNEAELWELINCFGQSFQSGLPENALADKIMAKLQKSHSRIIEKQKNG